jgi:hypothetical protein
VRDTLVAHILHPHIISKENEISRSCPTRAPYYSQRLEERRVDISRSEHRHGVLGYCKLAVVVGGAVVVWLALLNRSISIIWALIPAALLAGLAMFHERVLRHQERLKRAERYFEKALARLDGNWRGTGEPGDRYLVESHPYAQDLDLFGKGSLFELLSTARTHIGEDTLARWLLTPAAPDVVRARHDAVNELRSRLDLREELAVLAEDARTGVDPASLAAWGEAPALLKGGRLRAAAAIVTVLGVSGGCALGRLARLPNRPGPDGQIRVHSSARLFPDRLLHQFLVPLPPAQARGCSGRMPSTNPRTIESCFPKCWFASSKNLSAHSVLAALRKSSMPKATAIQAPRPSKPPDGTAGLSRAHARAHDRAVHVLDHAPGVRSGKLAAAFRSRGAALAHRHR